MPYNTLNICFSLYFEHFKKYQKAITFKFPFTVGPLTTKSRTAKEITQEILKEMNFQVGTKMHYDPNNVISEKMAPSKVFIILSPKK